jgi:serine protease Do
MIWKQSRLSKVSGRIAAAGLAAVLASGVSASAQSLQLIQVLQQPSLLMLHSRSQGFLGVDVGDLDAERVQALHLKDAKGAEITVLDHDAPAGKAGLKLHDVILSVNGQAIANAEQLKQMLHETYPGHKLQLVVSHDGAVRNLTVQLADRRKVQEQAREELGAAGSAPTQGFMSGGGDVPTGFHLPSWGPTLHVGAMVEPLTPQMSEFLGVTSGLMIKSVARKSAADQAGLKAHDVILGIGGEQVVTESDWERLLRSSEGKPVQVEIFRDRMKQLVLLQVDGKRHKS